jgi:hypothetical protein
MNPIRLAMSPISSATSVGSSSGEGTAIHAAFESRSSDMAHDSLRSVNLAGPLKDRQPALVLLDVDLAACQTLGKDALGAA